MGTPLSAGNFYGAAGATVPRPKRCEQCGREVDEQAPVLGRFHLACARMRWPFSIPTSLMRTAAMADEREQVQLRRDAINDQTSARSALGGGPAFTISPDKFQAIQPISDLRGRPVVRVFCDGLELIGTSSASRELPVLESEKRSFIVHGIELNGPHPEDLATPTVGGLVIVSADRRLSIKRAQFFDALRKQGLDQLVLWVLARTPEEAEGAEQQARAWLTTAGFRGDECPVVRSAKPSAEELSRVVALLDELPMPSLPPVLLRASLRELAQREAASATANYEAAVADNDMAGALKLLQIAQRSARTGASQADRELARRAAHDVDREELRLAIIALCALALAPADIAPLSTWFHRAAPRARTLTRELESAARVLIARNDESTVRWLMAQLARATTLPAANRVSDMLQLASEPAFFQRVIAEVPADSKQWPANEPRAKALKALLPVCKRRAKPR